MFQAGQSSVSFSGRKGVFLFSVELSSHSLKASSAVQVCMDAEGPVVTDPDQQPVQQRRQEMILMLQSWHLNVGSHYLNTEQDSFILKPNVRNPQLVKTRGFIPAFCKLSKVEFPNVDAIAYTTFFG